MIVWVGKSRSGVGEYSERRTSIPEGTLLRIVRRYGGGGGMHEVEG